MKYAMLILIIVSITTIVQALNPEILYQTLLDFNLEASGSAEPSDRIGPIVETNVEYLIFPYTMLGQSSITLSVVISNDGVGNVDILAGNISFAGDYSAEYTFSSTHLPVSLNGGESVEIPITFTPQGLGSRDTELSLTTDFSTHNLPIFGYAYPETSNPNDFEDVFPPAQWDNPGGWSQTNTQFFTGSASVYKHGDGDTWYTLITPKLRVNDEDDLLFMLNVSDIASALKVLYSRDKVLWAPATSINVPESDTWIPIILEIGNLPDPDPSKAEAEYYFAFVAEGMADYYIDN
ncbi:MAG: hypothetical protein PHS23_03565, partial [Candidatus Cloacimonetes bacterium]|nr:hypothetical protein [Candidatus Cloacimonadota bacterium]